MEKGSRNKAKKVLKRMVVEREKGYRKGRRSWLQDMETRSNRQGKRKVWMEAGLS